MVGVFPRAGNGDPQGFDAALAGGRLTVTLQRGAQKQRLHSREGGSADNLDRTFTLTSFNRSPIAGEWTLVVTDTARADKGTLSGWTLGAEL